jgi:hypothetical protein
MPVDLELKNELITWRVNVDNLKATNIRLREIFRTLVRSPDELDELYRDEIEDIFLESFGEEAIEIMRETDTFRTEHNKTPEKQNKMAQRRKLLDKVRHYYNKLRSDISVIFEEENAAAAGGGAAAAIEDELAEELYVGCSISDENEKSELKPAASPEGKATTEKNIFPDDCPICHQFLNVDDTVLTQPCGHNFHRDCIRAHFQHLKRKPKQCPICRQLITHYIDGDEDIPAQRGRGRPRGRSATRRSTTPAVNDDDEQKEEAAEEEDVTRLLFRPDVDPRTLPADAFDADHPYYALYIRMCNIANGTEPWQSI